MNRNKFFKKNIVLHSQNKVAFLHDNARPYVAKKVKNLFKEFKWEVLTHPLYSPDLAPSDYHFFRSLSHSLDGKNLNGKIRSKFFENCFEKKEKEFYKREIKNLIERWQKQKMHKETTLIKNHFLISSFII